MTFPRRMMSPGPSWTVLARPPSSSPSTRTNIRSDLDADVDMGDDEAEHEPDLITQPPISKRKALPDPNSPSARKHKHPRLDVNGTATTSPSRHAGPSRIQPGPPSSRLRNAASLMQVRVQSADSGASTSDFPSTITERVQRVLGREREERERQRQQERNSAEARTTARKQTTHPKNVRRVSTASLLKTAQTRTGDESVAWTRVRPKLKPKRTNLDAEMAATRPLAVARRRDSDVIELTDSSDSRRPRPPPTVAANTLDPIIITSGSEDERPVRATQWRKSGPQVQRLRARAPPPSSAEVISLTDSEEGTGGLPSASAPARTTAPAPAPVPASSSGPTVPVSEDTSVSISTRLPKPSSLQDTVRTRPSPVPSYGPPREELDDPFTNLDFGASDDANPPDEWDGLGAGTSLATIPVPSGDAVLVGTRASEGAEDAEAALFNSYLNMDQMTDEGGDQRAEDGLANGSTSMREEESSPEESSDVSDRDKDVHTQGLEEGEVDPSDFKTTFVRSMESGEILSQDPAGGAQTPNANVRMQHGRTPSTHTTGTPESGEVKSQGSGGVGSGSRPPSSAPSTGSVATTPPSTSTPALPPQSSSRTASLTSSSASPRLPTSQSLKRTGMLVMPDISSYKGIRFKRSLPLDPLENSFFSRALNGAGRPGKPPANVEEEKARDSPSMSVDVLPRVEQVRRCGGVHMQVDAVASTSEGVSTSLSPQRSGETSTVADTQSTVHAQQPLAVGTSTAINDVPPVSTQPTPMSVRETPYEPPATQPASSSSRPLIAPPRIPRPSTPVSLVDVLNEVRRDKLLKDERQLARKRSMADITSEHVTPAKSASRPVPSPSALPVPPSTPTSTQPLASSQIQTTRVFGKVPSLKDIRELLAKRNVSSPSARPPSTPSEDAGWTPAKLPSAVPASQLKPVAAHERTSQKSSVLDTPTPSTMIAKPSGSGVPSTSSKTRSAPFVPFEVSSMPAKSVEQGTSRKYSALDTPTPSRTIAMACASTSAKRRSGPLGPFEQFISPVGGSPTVQRPRTSIGMLVPRERHRRRESAAATFEAYIVRHLPEEQTQVEPADADTDSDSDRDGDEDADAGAEVRRVELHVHETERTGLVEVAERGSDVGEGGDEVTDANEMPDQESDEEGVGDDDVDGDDGGVADDATDETDALLELASVQLSQTNLDAEAEAAVVPESTAGHADEGDMDIVNELPAANDAPSPKTGNAMAVDGPPDDGEMDEETGTQPGSIDMPETWSYGTTPELILPEDSQSSTSEQNSNSGQAHERRRAGDSAEERDALLVVPVRSESESEEPSSRTASSTSLAPPRSRSRQRSQPIDSSDLLHLPSFVPGGNEGNDRCEHRIVTFESRVAEERERPPEYKLARDIPHSLQDYVNGVLSDPYRNSENAREMLEAHILESMGNEPDTPLIKIFDNNIGEEWTPAWEFHYTNEMWFGEGVPPPDRKGLVGCGCVGKCDPKSSTCLCAKRQLKWMQRYIDLECIPATWPGSPFVYDHKGSLQQLECPIFECNRFCACDEDCPNRVVQNGRKWPVHIAQTKDKGWGVIAGDKKIPKGSYLGIYVGELLTEQEAEARGRYYDLCGQTYLFTIDFHHLKMDMEDPEEFDNLYVVDAYHAGNFTRFLNHSCDPNCGIFACYIDDADIDKPLLAIFTTRDVEPWEELCFSYYGDIEEKREEIQRKGLADMRDDAVSILCRCGADNCLGRLFS